MQAPSPMNQVLEPGWVVCCREDMGHHLSSPHCACWAVLHNRLALKTVFFLHFLGLTCYFGVIFHLRIFFFFHLCRSQAALPFFIPFLGGSWWLQSALKQGMEVMCSLTLLSVLPLSLENRSAAARLVLLSHTQMFPFIIHPEDLSTDYKSLQHWIFSSMSILKDLHEKTVAHCSKVPMG